MRDRAQKPQIRARRNASEETRSPSTTAAPRNVPLCSTTELCCRFQPLALELTGKILKRPRTSAAVETNRQDSGEELKPLRARREKPTFSHFLVISPVFACRLGLSHSILAFLRQPSRPLDPSRKSSADLTSYARFSPEKLVVEHKGVYGSGTRFLHLSRLVSAGCAYGGSGHSFRTNYGTRFGIGKAADQGVQCAWPLCLRTDLIRAETVSCREFLDPLSIHIEGRQIFRDVPVPRHVLFKRDLALAE